MNTRSLLSRLAEKLDACRDRLRRLLAGIFGRPSWSPPNWLRTGWERFNHFNEARPRLTSAIVLALLLITYASAWTWHWYKTRPQPHRVTVRIQQIPVTPLEKDLKFPPLVLAFSESAAKLEDLGEITVTGPRLEPPLAGAWHWASSDSLVFQPTEDWPADQTYRIIFDKKFFPAHVLMERLAYETQTPPFAISFKELQFYQDPTNPKQQQITATLELTHSIDPGALERFIAISSASGTTLFAAADPAPHFALTYGLHQRLVYLRSSPVSLPEQEDFATITVNKGARTAQGGASTKEGIERKVKIPSLKTMFQIESVASTVTRNKNGEPEQLLVFATSADISSGDLARAIDLRLLPKRTPASAESAKDSDDSDASDDADETTPNEEQTASDGDPETDESADAETTILDKEKWKSAADVPDEVLKNAKKISFTAVLTEKSQSRQHALRFRLEGEGELYVLLHKGVRAAGDYPLVDDYTAVIDVPEMPREVQIQGEGGLLALNGERKLSIRSRGVPAIQYEVARVSTSQINHLVSQTEGDFAHTEFALKDFFNEDNISRIARQDQAIAMQNRWKANYSAFDFSEHLRKPTDGGSERGLFFLTARGFDPIKKKPFKTVSDRRFILVTDIGIVTKKAADGGHDVFLMSIKNQAPLANATVDILGKNGIALQTATTDANGHCAFTGVDKSVREKEPVAFVARNGDDVSFIPYARADRILNFSRFDVDGIENVLPENLDAFVFTERGVYRPGDEMHIGLVVKQRNWAGNLKGLPVETEVLDARDLRVQTKKLNLPENGFSELSYQTANESPTGLYTINVYLLKNSKRSTLLGSTTAQVKEFLPDRMKIDARLSQNAGHGWINPKDVRGSIALANLYGTPATDRRITAKIELQPTAFGFAEFKEFVFYDPLLEEKKDRQVQAVDLGEKKTDDAGRTEFQLDLDRFADATYQLSFIAEGFEAEGGRSVTADVTSLVSALPYVVGCKPEADLRYIEMNQPRAVDLVAVDPRLNRIAVENLTVNIVAQEYVSVLTKQENGNYAFQSVLRERTAKSEKISISANGLHYALPTDAPGNFICELRDDQNRRLTKTCFTVVGQGDVSRSLEKNAELEVKLDRAKYNSGDDIAVSITAPYAGSGLITIERDRVYAYQWFQANGTSSVQHIRVPEGFDGSGYVNVAFVRALDSREIFVSPLSYGVVPFTANMEKRRLKIDLNAAEKMKPGEPLRISYQTDRPAKIVVFAVDQGILQVTDYKTPDPIAYYFRKCALAVRTAQIVDLIIPEFSLLRSASAYGGGGDVQRLNPFRRVTEKPVVYWSGILDADSTAREVVYNVPDYFDGTLRIMAVAIAPDMVGSSQGDTLVRGPFVITPSVPVLAAPGDEFEAGITIANNIEGSGNEAPVQLQAEVSEQLSIVGPATRDLNISEGREQSVSMRFHVNDKLGGAEIRFLARNQQTETRRRATLSVRPPVPYLTSVRSRSFNSTSVDLPIEREMHLEFRRLNASISALPLGLAAGLDTYLKNFPHGCSEQITSGAFCRLLLADEADFGLSRAEVNKQMEYVFGVLRRRQNDQGMFGYWAPETGERISFVSVYVMDFLSEAKAAGFNPPSEMFAGGLRYLQKMAAQTPADLPEARTVAYAIYVLTKEDVITTNYILNLEDYLNKNQPKLWENDITAVYLAGSLHLLHKDNDADKLIGKFRLDRASTNFWSDFYQPLGRGSEYIAVLAREFPSRMKKIGATDFENAVVRPIKQSDFNTLSAAYAVRALKVYSRLIAQNPPELSISEISADKKQKTLVSGIKLLQRADFSGNARNLRFRSSSPIAGPGAFFQVVEAGFDRQVPNQPGSEIRNGLEVYREILGPDNKPATHTKLGEALRVRLHLRSLYADPRTNVAVIDLLPGGFAVVDASLKPGVSSIRGVDYVDVREDRAVFFASAPETALEIDYQIKSCNRGDFVVPPVFAESMYDRNIKARGLGGHITVTE